MLHTTHTPHTHTHTHSLSLSLSLLLSLFFLASCSSLLLLCGNGRLSFFGENKPDVQNKFDTIITTDSRFVCLAQQEQTTTTTNGNKSLQSTNQRRHRNTASNSQEQENPVTTHHIPPQLHTSTHPPHPQLQQRHHGKERCSARLCWVRG